jgi:hypothetical protein
MAACPATAALRHSHCNHGVDHAEATAKSSTLEKVGTIAFSCLEVLCLLGLTAYAAYLCHTGTLDPLFFYPSLGAGFLLGAYLEYSDRKKPEAHTHAFHDTTGCTGGAFEQWSGKKLPAFIALLINVVIAYCHIDHHSQFFVPIVGLNCGVWFGKWFVRTVVWMNPKEITFGQAISQPSDESTKAQ